MRRQRQDGSPEPPTGGSSSARTHWFSVHLGLLTFLLTFLAAARGYPETTASAAFASVFAVGLVTKPVTGTVSDRFDRTLVGTAGLVLAGVALLTLVAAPSPPWVLVSLLPLALGYKTQFPLADALVIETAPVGKRRRRCRSCQSPLPRRGKPQAHFGRGRGDDYRVRRGVRLARRRAARERRPSGLAIPSWLRVRAETIHFRISNIVKSIETSRFARAIASASRRITRQEITTNVTSGGANGPERPAATRKVMVSMNTADPMAGDRINEGVCLPEPKEATTKRRPTEKSRLSTVGGALRASVGSEPDRKTYSEREFPASSSHRFVPTPIWDSTLASILRSTPAFGATLKT